MRSPRLLASLWLAAGLLPLGCLPATLPLLQHVARPDSMTVSPPGEDGTRYIAVEGGRMATARTMHNRWKSTARRTCQGEYLGLSDAGYAQRQRGIILRRIHEGYVRCVMPDESEPGASVNAPTVADATVGKPKRRRAPQRTRRVRSRILGKR